MGLFDKLDRPIFLKETSDSEDYIKRLKELQPKTTGDLKKKIDLEIKLASIGKYGEDNVAFELKNSGLPMYILRDIHLEVDGLTAQIDFIVITRKLNFFIECKNLIGNIYIDNRGNFIREYKINGKTIKEGIYSPITQNQRHLEIYRRIRVDSQKNFILKKAMDKLFYSWNKSIVVLANPKTLLNAGYAKEEIKNQVIRADRLNKYIKDAYNASKQPPFNDKELESAAENILSRHTPKNTDYLKRYYEIQSSYNSSEEIVSKKEKNQQVKRNVKWTKRQQPKSDKINMNLKLKKKLKAYRLSQCRDEKIPPYFIFNDKQMKDLISKMPKTKSELLKVSGFGKVKIDKYGDTIIQILNEYR